MGSHRAHKGAIGCIGLTFQLAYGETMHDAYVEYHQSLELYYHGHRDRHDRKLVVCFHN